MDGDNLSSGIEDSPRIIDSVIWILEDYQENGFPDRRHRTASVNSGGRVLWKKTIRGSMPSVSERGVVYTELYTQRMQSTYDVLVEAYRFCLSRCSILLGWLYSLDESEMEDFDVEEVRLVDYLRAIDAELDQTFDRCRHSRLSHMSNIISNSNMFSPSDSGIMMGTIQYHAVLEAMIYLVFGRNDKKEYRFNADYRLKENSGRCVSRGDFVIDCIRYCKDGVRAIVIDSKNYKYGDTGSASDFPSAHDIHKQIAYGEYVSTLHPERTEIRNVFMIPYDKHGKGSETGISGPAIKYAG